MYVNDKQREKVVLCNKLFLATQNVHTNVLVGHPDRFISVAAALLKFSGKEKLQPRRRLPEAARAHFPPLALRSLLLITPNPDRYAIHYRP